VAAHLNELTSIEELTGVLDESEQRPVLIFKHSNACPISARALSEFRRFLEDADSTGASYNMVTVQEARAVSDEIASRLALEHESPQAILVRNRRPVWNASHFGITAGSLSDAISADGA